MGKCSRSKVFAASNGRRGRWRALAGMFVGLCGLTAAPGGLAGALDLRKELPAPPSLGYREILQYVVIVPVHLNGQGPFDMVLDTAATFTTLDPGLAAELGLAPLGRVSLGTIAGARAASRARLDLVKLGAIELSGVEVLCAEIALARSGDQRVRGILGQSTLRRLSFGLDYVRRVVVFEPPSRPDAVVALDEREGRPAVTFHLKRSGEALSLVIDSGLSSPVLFEKRGTPLAVARVAGGFFEAETNSGGVRLSMARLEGRIALLRIPAILSAVQDDAAAGGREEDGLLPARLFRMVYFDRARKELLLQRR